MKNEWEYGYSEFYQAHPGITFCEIKKSIHGMVNIFM
jgi:hypothetical protein